MITSGRIAVALRPEYDEYSLLRLADYAKRAEASGFESLWLAESWGLDAVTLLSHVGAHTSRIGLGTAIVNVYSRTPSLLAMTATTLNDLYGGRFTLGLGGSTKALVEGFHGLAFDKPLTRLRDAIQVVRQLTSGAELDYAGQTVTLKGYRLRVKPRHKAPPIYLASLAEDSIRLVGEMGDGWLPYLLPMRGLADAKATIAEAAREAGRTPDQICIAPIIPTAVWHDADEARDTVRRHVAFYLGAMGPHYRGFVARHGFEDEVEAIRAAWKRRDEPAAQAAVSDALLDDIAIVGTPADCAKRVAELHQAGVDLPILFFPGTSSNEMVELALETMGRAEGRR